jgi:hypothetical protein
MSTRDDEISRLRYDIDLCVRNGEFEKAVKLEGRLLGLQQRIRNYRKAALPRRRVYSVSDIPVRTGLGNTAKN